MVAEIDRKVANGLYTVTVRSIRRCYVSYIYTRIDKGYSVRILGLADTTGEVEGFESLAWQAYKVAGWIGGIGYIVVYDTLLRFRETLLDDLQTKGHCTANDLFRITCENGKYKVKASRHIRRELGEGHRLKLARGYLVSLERARKTISGVSSEDSWDVFNSLESAVDDTNNDLLLV